MPAPQARFLTVDEVAAINADLLGGGRLVDPGLLSSAVGRPAASMFGEDAYPSLHQKAAALFESLARNHAFLDGNKRTALLATSMFYRRNGWTLQGSDEELVGLTLAVATGALELNGAAARLQSLASPSPAVEDPPSGPAINL